IWAGARNIRAGCGGDGADLADDQQCDAPAAAPRCEALHRHSPQWAAQQPQSPDGQTPQPLVSRPESAFNPGCRRGSVAVDDEDGKSARVLDRCGSPAAVTKLSSSCNNTDSEHS